MASPLARAAAQTRHFVECKNTPAFDEPVFPQSHRQTTVRHGFEDVDGRIAVATRDPSRCPTSTIDLALMLRLPVGSSGAIPVSVFALTVSKATCSRSGTSFRRWHHIRQVHPDQHPRKFLSGLFLAFLLSEEPWRLPLNDRSAIRPSFDGKPTTPTDVLPIRSNHAIQARVPGGAWRPRSYRCGRSK